MDHVRRAEERVPLLTDTRAFPAVACGLVAVVIAGIGVTQALAARGGRVSSLVGITAQEPLAPAAQEIDPTFSFAADHLDGAYFYAVATDPLATGREHTLVDVPAYRFGHPGYGWLAWLVTAGRRSAVPAAFVAIGLVAMFVAGAGASVLATDLGWSPWAGLFVAFNPGLVFATLADNSEPLAVAVLALTLIAWLRDEVVWAGVGLLTLCLIKEQFVLVALGLAIWELVGILRRRVKRSRHEWAVRSAALAAGPVALGAWFAYLRSVFGVWPFQQHPLLINPFAIPPTGYLDTIRRAAGLHASSGDAAQVGGIALPLLVVVGAALVVGIVRAARFTSPLDPVFILLAVLVFSLTWAQLLYPKDLVRIVATQLALLPAALAGARGGALAAPAGASLPSPGAGPAPP